MHTRVRVSRWDGKGSAMDRRKPAEMRYLVFACRGAMEPVLGESKAKRMFFVSRCRHVTALCQTQSGVETVVHIAGQNAGHLKMWETDASV